MDPNQWLGPFSWEEELRDKAIYDASMHDVMIYPGISTSTLILLIWFSHDYFLQPLFHRERTTTIRKSPHLTFTTFILYICLYWCPA